jgi:hypothetical protein
MQEKDRASKKKTHTKREQMQKKMEGKPVTE